MIRIFIDPETGDKVMVDSETAFGPVFGVDEDPQKFIDWVHGCPFVKRLDIVKRLDWDITTMPPNSLANYIDVWRQEIDNANEAKAERVMSDTEATTMDEQCAKAKEKK